MQGADRSALIFANGDLNDGWMVRRALGDCAGALIIAADGGARIADHFDCLPEVVIGDMDSIAEDHLARLASAGVEIIRHPREKDETDLELALLLARERGARRIRVIGAIGDRIDQTLSNVYLLALAALADCDVRIVAGRQETWLASPGETLITGAAGDTVSLLPLGGTARGITTEGLYYPLHDGALGLGPARGVSNELTGDRARVHLREGVLLIIHTQGKA